MSDEQNEIQKVKSKTVHLKLGIKNIHFSNVWKRTQEFIKLYDYYLTSNQLKTDFVISQRINAYTLNIGYYPTFTKVGPTVQKSKPYDVLFLGDWAYPKREYFLNKLKKHDLKMYPRLDRYNIILGWDKYKAIRDSKICLNISKSEVNVFSKFRIIKEYMNNCAFVLTEKIYGCEGFIDGQHWIEGECEDLIDLVLEWKDRHDDRQKISFNAFSYISQKYTLQQGINNLLKEIQGSVIWN